MKNNYYHIENEIDLEDIFEALPILSEEGILILMDIPNIEIIDILKEYQINNIKFPNIGKSITFGSSGKINIKNIGIEFNKNSKNILIELSKKFIPNLEICSYLFYQKKDGKEILEYISDNDIFISRNTIKSDQIIRTFCKKIKVSRYCLEDFI